MNLTAVGDCDAWPVKQVINMPSVRAMPRRYLDNMFPFRKMQCPGGKVGSDFRLRWRNVEITDHTLVVREGG